MLTIQVLIEYPDPMDNCLPPQIYIREWREVELTPKELEKIDDMATLQDILTTVAETGEYEDLGHCEQCGDWITSYTLEI